jgi:hypothetical protein
MVNGDARLMPRPRSLPVVLEVKETLDDRRHEFRCGLLEASPGRAVVLFVTDRAYRVHDVHLPPGTVTFGHFWTARPFNAYHWLTPDGATIAYYFNLSDGTEITEEAIRWRDLAVDVLARPGGRPLVLDEHELPADLPLAERADIARARAQLEAELAALCADLERRAGALWAAAFGEARP